MSVVSILLELERAAHHAYSVGGQAHGARHMADRIVDAVRVNAQGWSVQIMPEVPELVIRAENLPELVARVRAAGPLILAAMARRRGETP